jgi:hypothetical protein
VREQVPEKSFLTGRKKTAKTAPTHLIHFPKFIAAALRSALIALPNVPLRRFRSKRCSLFTCPMMGSIAEALNSVFSAVKRKARGFRSTDNLIAMLYFTAAKLRIPATH